MKLIWIFLLIYIIVRVLGRVKRVSERIQGDYPADAAEEVAATREDPEDRPLSGPWNRRPAPSPAGGDMTPGKGNDDDLPLQGTWSRRENPVPEPVRNEPVEAADRKEERTPESVAAEPAGQYLPERIEEDGRPSDEILPIEICRTGRHRKSAFVHGLFSPQGLYNGIIMSEVLGSRGGRSRRR